MIKTFSIRLPITMVGMGTSNNIGELVKEFGATNTIIITDATLVKAGLLDNIKLSIKNTGCKFDIFDGCLPNAPTTVVEECSKTVKSGGYDLVIGVGGGSVMDTAKAVSVMAPNNMSFSDFISGKPINKVVKKILVPTTSGTGSEWSNVAVYHGGGETMLAYGNHILANAAVIDPELSLNLSARITGDTGMDALIHAIESYISPQANIVSESFAESSIKIISENLRLAYCKGSEHPEVRYKLAIAASMAMGAVAISTAGIAHFLSSEIDRRAHIPHGESCLLLLPHTMEFNLIGCPAKFVKIAELMGEKVDGLYTMDAAQKAIAAIKRLAMDLGMPQKLSEIGITKSDISKMADTSFKTLGSMMQRVNPREVTRDDIFRIYTAAL